MGRPGQLLRGHQAGRVLQVLGTRMVRSQTATGASLQQRGRSARVDLVHAGAGTGRVEVQQLLLQIDVIVENWGVAAHESLLLHTLIFVTEKLTM